MPAIPASAIGVLKTRSRPKSRSRSERCESSSRVSAHSCSRNVSSSSVPSASFLATSSKSYNPAHEIYDDVYDDNGNWEDGWWIDDVMVTHTLMTPATVAVDSSANIWLPGRDDSDGDGVIDMSSFYEAGRLVRRELVGDAAIDAADETLAPMPSFGDAARGDG